jgi:Raf kinase inhibitor-like YbhB/YbcL family protein
MTGLNGLRFYCSFPAKFVCILLLVALPSACKESSVVDPAPNSVKLTSDDFQEGQQIPQRFTCTGNNISPALSWENLPAGTKSLTLLVSDPDAILRAYVHWVLYNLPPEPNHLAQGVQAIETLPDGARQGKNSGKRIGYSGPCPPGKSPHRYIFTLYALDTRLDAGPPPASTGSAISKDQLMKLMQGHVLASGQLTGKFSR